MNLNDQPTLDELAQLFAACEDKHYSHILWVCQSGEVHIDRLAHDTGEEEFEKLTPTLRARFKTYRRGKGYVGKKAAADKDFIGRVYRTLAHEWSVARTKSEVTYIDRYC